MIKKELESIFYEKAKYTPSKDLIEKAISYYEQKKDNNYKKLNCFISIDDLILYMIKIDKKNFYKENFILAFKNKHKRKPTLSELKKIDSKIKETDDEDDNYNPTTNQSFILSLLSLFTLSEILSETKLAEENSYISDLLSISDKPSYSSESKSEISTDAYPSSGSGTGCSGSGSGCSGGS